MKTFKQFLKEATIKEGNELDATVEIRFENLGGGFDAIVHPFDVFENDNHTMNFNCFSSGDVTFVRKASKEELEKYEEGKRLSKDGKLSDNEGKKYPYFQIKQEARKAFTNEIYKAAQEFDKKIVDIAKKYGYKKK